MMVGAEWACKCRPTRVVPRESLELPSLCWGGSFVLRWMMKLFRFEAQVEKPITQFGSVNVMLSHLVRLTAGGYVNCMHVAANGVVGYHQTVGDQLFLVVQGEGWVRTEETERVPIAAGWAAFWMAGEWHETSSATGLTAIVIEGEKLEPSQFMIGIEPTKNKE